MDNAKYLEFVKTEINFDKIVENVKWLYENKGKTEVVVKIPGMSLQKMTKKNFMILSEIIRQNFCRKFYHVD